MNKVLQSCLIALAATALFSACQKDKEHLVDLTAVIVDQPVSNAKVYIDGNYGCWQQGDAVKIKSGSNGTDSYSLTVDGSKATIKNVEEGTPYTAGYPGGNVTAIGDGTLNIEVPSSQSYVEAAIYYGAATNEQRIVCPMAAYSPDGSTLKFYNVAAMLAVTVTNSESSALTLYAVEVESDKSPLSGTATVTVNADTAYISSKASTSNNVTLTFDTPVTLAASARKTVYIPVLPIGSGEGEKSTLTVHVKATKSDGTKKYTFHDVSRSAISIAQNQIGNVPITLNTSNPETEVNDYFWGQGKENCPFLIASQADLENLRTVTNAGTSGYVGNGVYYKQTADIPLSSWTTAIGNTSSYAFSANYNGGGHSITNLTLNETDEASYGLFGYAGGGNTIKNITVDGSIKSSYKAGYDGIAGLVGESTAALTIERCTTNVSIIDVATGNLSYMTGHAGILGCASGATTIRYCKNTGDVIEGTGHYIRGMAYGGILGINNNASTSIEHCDNTGNILQERTNNTNVNYGKIGGICGQTMVNINISNCTNSGTIRNTGNSSSSGSAGGILGAVYEQIANDGGSTARTISNITVSNCTNTGDVSLTANTAGYSGGIIGVVGSVATNSCASLVVTVTVSDCIHQNANVSSVYRAGGIVGLFGAQNTSSLTISGCKCIGGDEYSISSGTGNYTGGIVGYAGNLNTKLSISNCENHIPVSGGAYCGGILGYVSNGSSSSYAVEITGCSNTAMVRTTGGTPNYAAGIVACVKYHSLTIDNCHNTGAIRGGNYTGGLVGSAEVTTINQSYNQTADSIKGGSYTGGLVGTAGNLTITKSYNDACVKGTSERVGGLVGNSAVTNLTQCHNLKNVHGATHTVGGLAGRVTSGTFNKCLNEGDVRADGNSNSWMNVGGLLGYGGGVSILNCGNTGNVSGTSKYAAAGFIGDQRAAQPNVRNSFCKADVSTSGASGQAAGLLYSNNLTVGASATPMANCYYYGTITAASYNGSMVRQYTTGQTCYLKYCYDARANTSEYTHSSGKCTAATIHAEYKFTSSGAFTGSVTNEYYSSSDTNKNTLTKALNGWVKAQNGDYLEWEDADGDGIPVLKFSWD